MKNVSYKNPSSSDMSTNRQQIIRDEDMQWIQISLTLVVRECASIIGVISNVFNVIIFIKIGLKDSMNMGLFALSLTDVLQSLCQVASCTCYAVDAVYPSDGPLDLRALGNSVLGWTVNATYRMSCWITAWISLERCFCVVAPFKVKRIFSRFRCGLVIVTIYVVHICIYSPVFLTHRMQWTKKPTMIQGCNSTATFIDVFTVILTAATANVEFIFDVTFGIVWLFLSNVIVIVCAVLLSHSLHASSKIRQVKKSTHRDSNKKRDASLLTNREKRLVKVVLVLAVILTVCNIPKYIVFLVYHTLPGMNTGGQRNLTALLWNIVPVIANIGCSVNIIVYFNLNSRFRQEVRRCIGVSGSRNSGDAGRSPIEEV